MHQLQQKYLFVLCMIFSLIVSLINGCSNIENDFQRHLLQGSRTRSRSSSSYSSSNSRSDSSDDSGGDSPVGLYFIGGIFFVCLCCSAIAGCFSSDSRADTDWLQEEEDAENSDDTSSDDNSASDESSDNESQKIEKYEKKLQLSKVFVTGKYTFQYIQQWA